MTTLRHDPWVMCVVELPKSFCHMHGWIMTWHILMQEFRRLQSALGAARDRAELFAGSSDASPLQVTHMVTHFTQDQVSLQGWGRDASILAVIFLRAGCHAKAPVGYQKKWT